MKSKLFARLSGGFAVLVGLFAAPVAHAQRVAILPACTISGNCTLCDFVTLAANISQLILSIIGGVVLGMFVLGGIMWLISAGSSERVQKGKQIITGSVIGLMITLGGYMAVNAVIAGFTGASFSEAQVFGQDWNEFCSVTSSSTVLDTCEDSGNGEINFGVACNTDGCNDPAVCVCFSGDCITACQMTGAQAQAAGESVVAGCLVNADECKAYEEDVSGSRTYYQEAGGTLCPDSSPWCCSVEQ